MYLEKKNLGRKRRKSFDNDKPKFSKRDEGTVYVFPNVDREAVFNTLKLMEA